MPASPGQLAPSPSPHPATAGRRHQTRYRRACQPASPPQRQAAHPARTNGTTSSQTPITEWQIDIGKTPRTGQRTRGSSSKHNACAPKRRATQPAPTDSFPPQDPASEKNHQKWPTSCQPVESDAIQGTAREGQSSRTRKSSSGNCVPPEPECGTPRPKLSGIGSYYYGTSRRGSAARIPGVGGLSQRSV